MRSARALPPFNPPRRPKATAAGSLPSSGSTSSGAFPVASSTSRAASWFRSLGRLRERSGIASAYHRGKAGPPSEHRLPGRESGPLRFPANPTWRNVTDPAAFRLDDRLPWPTSPRVSELLPGRREGREQPSETQEVSNHVYLPDQRRPRREDEGRPARAARAARLAGG